MEEKRAARKNIREEFIVRIIYNEHATWQGEITWVEKQEKQYFRSALELLKLIDRAVEESQLADSRQMQQA